MNMTFLRWLASQINALDSVRQVGLHQSLDMAEPILYVQTWSATIIHVHVLDAMPKTRALKKIISDNSRIGIGTLFILDAALMPPDGEKLMPPDALAALHALFKGKIYTYHLENSTPSIGQVHFKPYGRGDEIEVWYGPDIEIKHLPSYRVWVKQPNSIKGDWVMANLGSDSFWKHADYTAGRDAFRRQQRGGFTQQATYSSADWNGGARYTTESDVPTGNGGDPAQADARALARGSRLDSSFQVLGISTSASADEVKNAFRRLARELHPDTSTLPKAEAEQRFRRLNEAYTYIKTTKKW